MLRGGTEGEGGGEGGGGGSEGERQRIIGEHCVNLIHQHLLWVLDKTLSPNTCYTHIVHYK